MLKCFRRKGLIKVRGRARTDSTHVLAAIHQLNRIECVAETMNWTGYTVHLTETCDSDKPHLITHVETTPATTGDVEMTGVIHQALADKDLLPGEHLVDTAYVDAQHLLSSQVDYDLDLVQRGRNKPPV